jgi:putative ATP-dependent endonuclease of OLD family
LQIKNITIKNYRGIKSLEKLEISLLNAIVGKNDAGKSAILHAINSFFYDIKLNAQDKYYGANGESTVIEVTFVGEELLQLPNTLLDAEGLLHIKKEAENAGDNYNMFIIVKDFCNGSYKNIMQLTAAKLTALFREEGIDAVTPYSKEDVFKLIHAVEMHEERYENEQYEIKGSLLKNLLKELYPQYSLFLADTSLDTGASSFQNQFKKIITNAIEAHINDFSNLQIEVSNTLENEVKKVQEYMKRHYPGLDSLQTEINYDWSKLVNFNVNMTDESQFEVSLSHKGTGIQRLFMVSYFQYLAEQSENDRSSYIFAIEEPETFLHPGAQRTLLESIKHISEFHQVIITTHSPVFASEIHNDNIIVASKEVNQSVYKQAENVSAELLVDELGIRASDSILLSKLLVFVEGSNDLRFWKIIYKLIMGHDYEEDGILMLPGGGNELHNIAEMNLMQKLNRNFMVIVDKDSGAVDYEAKLLKQQVLKSKVENKGGELVVLRKREIENYYHPRIVLEKLQNEGIDIDTLEIQSYDDVQRKIKDIINGTQIQFKIKNNMEIFTEMSIDDWREISTYSEDGEQHFELEEIVKMMKEKANL